MTRGLRHTALGALALALSACGFAGEEYRNVYGALKDSLGVEDGEPVAQPSYEQVFALPYASLALSVEALMEDGDAPALLAAITASGGRVWYLDGSRRGVALDGGRIAGTRGMTQDVLGAPAEAGADPLREGALAADWPATTLIVQRRRDGLGREAARAFSCRVEVVGPEVVETYQVTRDLVHVREHCANARGGFVNDHWLDPETGAMRRTRQWLGPKTGFVSVAIIKGLDGT